MSVKHKDERREDEGRLIHKNWCTGRMEGSISKRSDARMSENEDGSYNDRISMSYGSQT